jgi:hypothetical protein
MFHQKLMFYLEDLAFWFEGETLHLVAVAYVKTAPRMPKRPLGLTFTTHFSNCSCKICTKKMDTRILEVPWQVSSIKQGQGHSNGRMHLVQSGHHPTWNI